MHCPRTGMIAVGALLVLAGCSRQEATSPAGQSSAQAAQSHAAAPTPVVTMHPRAGRWESTMRLEKMEVANLPPQARAAMQNQRGMTQTFTTCLTPEQAIQPDARFFQNSAENCTYDHFTMQGGRIDAEMSCKAGKGTTRTRMVGSFSADTYDVAISSKGEMQPGMPMTVEMAIRSRRTGDCTGKEDK